jgi:NTP pyrophosphatase (non-canonical NTP hydrolase)
MKFSDLEQANRLRLPHFKNRQGKPAHSQKNGHDWSIAEWTNAMAGEAGEACNIAKKMIRGDYGDDVELGVGELMDEIADVVIYADLVCQRLNRRRRSLTSSTRSVSESGPIFDLLRDARGQAPPKPGQSGGGRRTRGEDERRI